MYQTVLFSIEDHVAAITFNRPNQMNSFNDVMSEELAEITTMIKSDLSVRAVLLKGAGKLFMAGGDISFFQKKLDRMPEGVQKIVRALNMSILNLMKMKAPVVASVHGSVAGVGMSFMMAADLVIAATTTRFTMAYSGIGVSPDGGASYHLPRIVGSKKAMEWLLLSELFTAEEALKAGLINWAVSENELEMLTNQLILKLSKGPTQAFGQIKQLVNDTWEETLENQLAREGHAFEFCSTTTDFKSGVNCFLEKKQPEFVGE